MKLASEVNFNFEQKNYSHERIYILALYCICIGITHSVYVQDHQEKNILFFFHKNTGDLLPYHISPFMIVSLKNATSC